MSEIKVSSDILGHQSFFCCLNFPYKLSFGVDIRSWKFCSAVEDEAVSSHTIVLTNLPQRRIFVHYSTPCGIIQGFFFEAQAGTVHVVKYDDEAEEIIIEPLLTSEGESKLLESIYTKIKGQDKVSNGISIGKYDMEKSDVWSNLMSLVDILVLKRCKLSSKVNIVPGEDVGLEKENSTEKISGQQASFPFVPDLISMIKNKRSGGTTVSMEKNAESYFNFFEDPSVVTKLHFDSSELLKLFLQVEYNSNEDNLSHFTTAELVIGTFQLSYVLFIYLGSYNGLEFWKRMLCLFSKSESFIEDPSNHVFVDLFFQTLVSHLTIADLDEMTFSSDLFQDSAIKNALLQLKSLSLQTTAFKNLSKILKELLGECDIEDEDDKPLVVAINSDKDSSFRANPTKEQCLEELKVSNATTEYDENNRPLRMKWMQPNENQ